jgi:hypothetical protein
VSQVDHLTLQRHEPGVRLSELLLVPNRGGDSRREPMGLGPEPLVHRPEPIELRAVSLVSFAIFSLELVEGHAEPLDSGHGRSPLDREAVTLSDGRLELRLAVTDQRRESIGFGGEPIDFGPQPIDLGAVLLDSFPLLSLEPRDRDAEPLGFRRGAFPPGSNVVALGENRGEFSIAVTDQGRKPIELAAGGQQVGLPLLLPHEGRILESRAMRARRGKLVLKQFDFATEALHLTLEPLDQGSQRGPLLRDHADLARRDLAQLAVDRFQVGLEMIPLLLKPVASGKEIIPLGGEAIPILGGFVPLRLEPVTSGRDPVVRGSQLLDLGSQRAISRQPFGMGCVKSHMHRLKLPVRRLKSFVLGPDLVVRRLKPLVLGRDLLTLTAESLELLAEDIGAILHRGRELLEAGGLGAGKIGDDEGHITLAAANLPSATGPPNAQRGSTVRTGHNDPLGLVNGQRQRRRRGGYATALVRSVHGYKDLVAVVAADLLAEISPPDPQLGRAMRAVGEKMALSIGHGITLV